MLDCTTPKYRELYARWLTDPGKLLNLGNMRPDDRVIDLCGGTGFVAREAIARGAKFALVADLNPRVSDLPENDARIQAIWGNSEDIDALLDLRIEALHGLWDPGNPHNPRCLCRLYRPGTFDLVVCRQAINYLDLDKVAAAVHKVLRPGGRFAFNTFGKPRWTARTYLHGGKRFFEAAGFWRDHVVHLQAAPSIGLDVTKFRWHKPEEIRRAMSSHFQVKEILQKNSAYYLCTK